MLALLKTVIKTFLRCLSAVHASSIHTIDHICTESGQRQMECDAAHSAIESALRNKDLFCRMYLKMLLLPEKEILLKLSNF